ncbi:Tryptophan synthase alpha chain [Minicystis rosea]|nr:Tryptophan synthase alpha chain [Minicystis rosea]
MPFSAPNRRRVAAATLLSLLFLGATQACSSSTSVTCGPGTVLSGAECVPSSNGTGGTGGSMGTGGTGGVMGTGGSTTSTGTGGSEQTCKTQCDCFSGTTCSVEGTCAPTSLTGACDDQCQSDADCPCGRHCDSGVCAMPTSPKFAGSGTSCQADCDCPGDGGSAQRCVGGRCIIPCSTIGPQCADDSACSACNKVCLGNGSCADPGACSLVVDCLPMPGEVCEGGACVAPPGKRYATANSLPAMPDKFGTLTLTINVPTGVTVHGLVVVLDAQFDAQTPPPPSGPLTLMGPDGTSVTLASTFMWTYASNGLTRVAYPSLDQPPPPNQPDLTPFEGKSGSGTWTFTLSSGSSYQVANLALYIE